MPSELSVIPMSFETYRVMPHRLGWKHEYWDGAARLSPSLTSITQFELPVVLPVSLRVPDENISLYQTKLGSDDFGSVAEYNSEMAEGSGADRIVRHTQLPDTFALIDLFKRTFEDSIEYTGYSDSAFEQEAIRTINFEEAHILSSEQKGHLAGAIRLRLINSPKDGTGAVVEPIMVEPAEQRKGVASELLRNCMTPLVDLGVSMLYSYCHLGNAPSLRWHEKNGFVEVPNIIAMNARKHHYHWMIGHHESCGNQTAAELAHKCMADCIRHLRKLKGEQS